MRHLIRLLLACILIVEARGAGTERTAKQKDERDANGPKERIVPGLINFRKPETAEFFDPAHKEPFFGSYLTP